MGIAFAIEEGKCLVKETDSDFGQKTYAEVSGIAVQVADIATLLEGEREASLGCMGEQVGIKFA